jgi:hypothetical protein
MPGYTDNRVYTRQDVSEGRQAFGKARYLLEQTGFALKGENGPPADLPEEGNVPLRGFVLSGRNGAIRFDLGNEAWSPRHGSYLSGVVALRCVGN